MLRGKKIRSVIYSHSSTKEKTSGLNLSRPMWALSTLNSIVYVLDAALSWGKKIISSVQTCGWGFINTVTFLSANIRKCSAVTVPVWGTPLVIPLPFHLRFQLKVKQIILSLGLFKAFRTFLEGHLISLFPKSSCQNILVVFANPSKTQYMRETMFIKMLWINSF